MKAVLSEKGQVTIPKPLRERLGLRPGHVLVFSEERGRLVAAKQSPEDPIERVYGVLKTGRTTDTTIRRLRGKVDAT
jgi:AbrB family looped-hinge helix DNA binding protein